VLVFAAVVVVSAARANVAAPAIAASGTAVISTAASSKKPDLGGYGVERFTTSVAAPVSRASIR